jgi:hypothetical protein
MGIMVILVLLVFKKAVGGRVILGVGLKVILIIAYRK